MRLKGSGDVARFIGSRTIHPGDGMIFTHHVPPLDGTTAMYTIPYPHPKSARNASYWRINGFPATILVWTQDEWERMEVRPSDAQYHPCGIWCALRVDSSG